MKFKIGDKVKIRKDVTLEEISNNNFNGCQYDTMCFLLQASYHDFKYKYRIRGIIGNAVLIFSNNKFYYVNPIILEKKDNETILDNEEKEYLKAVIKPFRDKIKYIVKMSCVAEYECILIDLGSDNCMLPDFNQGTMYKNMENAKAYTLEELGL